MFCNIRFNLLNSYNLFDIADNKPKVIVPVNAQVIVLANKNRRFMNIINSNYSTFDGEVPFKIARLKRMYRKAEALKGSEIIYDFIEFAKKNGLRVFLLGGKETSNKKSIDKLTNEYDVKACGYSPEFENYPFSEKFVTDSINRISLFKPDILFIGFGAPKQEFFIDDQYKELEKLGIKYIISCGGTFEFFSGEIKRAPKWISKIGLEGLYRLTQEMNKARLMRLLESFGFFKYIISKPDYQE